MKQLSLAVESRENTGRCVNRRLRKAGKIPAVIYGSSGNRSLSISDVNFRLLLRSMAGKTSIIELIDDKDKKFLSVLHETQRDACTDQFIHADFREVSTDKEMQFSLPIAVIGESIGVKNENGLLEVQLHEVNVRCLPKNLPSNVEVDISELKVGDSIYIKDLNLGADVICAGDPDQLVISCASITKKLAAEDAAAEAAEAAEAEASETESDGEEKSAEGDATEEKKEES